MSYFATGVASVDENAHIRHFSNPNLSSIPSSMLIASTKSFNSNDNEMMDLQVTDALLEYGLIEALITTNECPQWHDAYLIDVKIETEYSNSDEAFGGDKPGDQDKFVCILVLAIVNEEPFITISKKENVRKCTLDQVRLKLKFDPEFNIFDSEKILVPMERQKPFVCWQAGKIKLSKENFVVVEIDDEKNMDIFEKNCLRPQKSTFQLSEDRNPFFRFSVPISQDLLQLDQNLNWLSNSDLHKDFKKCLQLVNVQFDCESKSLVCLAIAFNDKNFIKEQTIKRSKMLSSMHFSKLHDNFMLSTKLDAFSGTNINLLNEFVLHLTLNKQYIGLAIGKGGNNIQYVRKLPGIISLELDDDASTFIIRGESFEACQKAAELLHFLKEEFSCPSDYADFFSEQKLIEEIVKKSGLFKLQIYDFSEAETNTINLLLIGRPSTIENFKIIFAYQKAEFDEIKALKKQNQVLFQQMLFQQRTLESLDLVQNRFSLPRNFAEAVKSGMKN